MAAGLTSVAGFGPAGPGDRGVAGVALEEAQRHLGAAGVVRAQEQHDGFAVVVQALDPGQCLQPLAGEAFGEQRQEVGDGGPAGELVVGGVQEPFDRLGAEGADEVSAQPGGGGLEGDLLVEGDVRRAGRSGSSGCLRIRMRSRRGARSSTRQAVRRTAASKAPVLPTRTGSGTDQCRSATWPSSSWAWSQTVMTRSPPAWTSSRRRGRSRRSGRWCRCGSRDGAGVDPRGGMGAGARRRERDWRGARARRRAASGRSWRCRRTALGALPRTVAGRRVSRAPGTRLQVGAPPVALGPRPHDDALVLEHLEVVGQQVGGHGQHRRQLGRGGVAEAELSTIAQSRRVGQRGVHRGTPPQLGRSLSVHCLNID